MKFDVQKSTLINASLAHVHNLVSDFNNWTSWSPWTIIEPECVVTVEGTTKEIGHSMSWEGEVIGSGKNTLLANTSHQLDYHLEFFKPWKSQASVSFQFEEIENQTNVTWTMNSSMPFFLFFMVKTMKKWIGMDYDRGLRMLKEIAEQGEVNCNTSNNGIGEHKGFSYVGLKRSVAINEMREAMQEDFSKIVNDIVISGQKGARHWVCIYPKFDMKNMTATYIAAISDEDLADLELDEAYVRGTLADSKSLEIKHDGSYEFLGNAWSMGMMFMQAKKYKSNGDPFEQYWNSPMEEAPEDLKTSIFFPVK